MGIKFNVLCFSKALGVLLVLFIVSTTVNAGNPAEVEECVETKGHGTEIKEELFNKAKTQAIEQIWGLYMKQQIESFEKLNNSNGDESFDFEYIKNLSSYTAGFVRLKGTPNYAHKEHYNGYKKHYEYCITATFYVTPKDIKKAKELKDAGVAKKKAEKVAMAAKKVAIVAKKKAKQKKEEVTNMRDSIERWICIKRCDQRPDTCNTGKCKDKEALFEEAVDVAKVAEEAAEVAEKVAIEAWRVYEKM